MINLFFDLLENKCDVETQKNLANTILLAQDFHEETGNYVEGKGYIKSQFDCAEHAAKQNKIDDFYIKFVAVLNEVAWNEAQDWANDMLKKEEEKTIKNDLSNAPNLTPR